MNKLLLPILAIAFAACTRTSAAPTPTSQWLPTSTAAPTTTPLPATSTPAPSATPQPPTATPLPSPTPTPAFPKVPEYKGPGAQKDKSGRVLGGNILPIVNYSPSMVTGKPCPRVSTWNVEVVDLGQGFRIANVDNPCVVQNAIDDYVEIAWATYPHLDPGEVGDVPAFYQSNPLMKQRISDIFLKANIEGNKWRTLGYAICNPLRVAVINPEPKTLVDWQSGTFMDLEVMLEPLGLKGAQCESRAYGNADDVRTISSQEADVRKKGVYRVAIWLVWDKQLARWRYAGINARSTGYQPYDWGVRLYAKAGLK